MAKRSAKTNMSGKSYIKKIVVTGPESTGKTTLAEALAEFPETIMIPEYAREYVENLDRKYTYSDVEKIAQYQINREKICERKAAKFIIFDTWLIITKVWFEIVFGKCPEWVNSHIKSTKIDLFLVCDIDLPWIEDPVRENGGQMRENLLDLYCKEIKSFGFQFEIISGTGSARVENALRILKLHGLILKP